jgi:primosomal protein N' (replication factor Y)
MPADQPQLFEREPAPWELDDAEDHSVATVVLASGPEKPFDYLVPDELRGLVEPGCRVEVPFGRGNRQIVGYCIDVQSRKSVDRRLKPLAGLVDAQRLITPAMLRLARWMADYYLCPLGQVFETILPAGVRDKAGTRLATFLSVPDEVLRQLATLELPPKQRQIMRYLAASPEPITAKQLAQGAKSSLATVNELRKKGLIRSQSRRVGHEAPLPPAEPSQENFELQLDQRMALDSILAMLNAKQHGTLLIHGVTGSGKTEVYMQAIQEVISYGRQAIVLVPEISLTPQAQSRFRSRFGRVAVLHSHLSDVERHRHWQQIASGQVPVVVGARSAVFAPTPNLGLIILDEEHESTFKQDNAPRYHARDVALMRCRDEGVPLVLGSATPSLESWHRAQVDEFKLVSMPRRVLNRPMPDVATIDLRTEFKNRRHRGAISRQLTLAMEQALRDDGQVILLLNRRGHSTHVQCPACGFSLKCPHCAISLTHHHSEQLAICHYCDYRELPPTMCPECRYPGLRYSGFGTQKLEHEVRSRFPDVPCLRMDTDTMQRPGSHQQAFEAFERGDVRILLGTQMIAKGLDFPNVLLVGVINADTALHLPDFRAAERTFQLVTQVAGRTGRGERGGRVLVQTFAPEHPAIEAAVRHDFHRFATAELPMREAMCYPPYAAMVRMVVRGPVDTQALAFAKELGTRLTALCEKSGVKARVLGPAAAPISKVRDLFRFHLQIQSLDGPGIRQAVKEVAAGVTPPDGVQWIIDVDPLDML